MSLASSNGTSESLAPMFGTFIQSKENPDEGGTITSSSFVNKSFFGDHQMNGLLPVEGMEEDGGEEREDEEEGQMQLDGQEEEAQNAKNDGHQIDFSMLAFQLLQHSQAQQAAAAAAAASGLSMNGQSQQQEQQQKENKLSPDHQQSASPASSSPGPPRSTLENSPKKSINSTASSASTASSTFPPPPIGTCPSPSSTSSKSKSSNSRRSGGSKSLLSAAAAAALLAPSPLGQIPSIPGAIAVAVSPAAQLFRDDDWSWHRNPAAAIRSGGTNKQTPVWKYFVYNKAENLSRCIVGNCTYQLKGPHTSTLACHLKKHTAEYAEFQRLKSDYTRERIAAGHGQAGRLDDLTNADGSGCSTPCSSNNGGEGGGGGCHLSPSPIMGQNGGGGGVHTPPPSAAMTAPAHLSPFSMAHHHRNSSGTSSGGSSSMSGASSPGLGSFAPSSAGVQLPPGNGLPCQLPLHPQSLPPLSSIPNGPHGGIFGPFHQQQQQNGCFPSGPPHPLGGFQHFLMAAALAAAHQQNGAQILSAAENNHGHSRPNTLELFGPNGPYHHSPIPPPPNGFHPSLTGQHFHDRKAPPPPLQQMNGGANGGGVGGGGGNFCGGRTTGTNLLDILNLLNEKAAQLRKESGTGKQNQGEEGKIKEEEEEAAKEGVKEEDNRKKGKEDIQMDRRKGRKRPNRGGGGGGAGSCGRAVIVGAAASAGAEHEDERQLEPKRREKEPPTGGGGASGLSHSVEHLLANASHKLADVEERMEEGGEDDGHGGEEADESGMDMQADGGADDGLALLLGTGLAPGELARLLENPFLQQGHLANGLLTVQRIEQTLNRYFHIVKQKIVEELKEADPNGFTLMAEFNCARCWNVPKWGEAKCTWKECNGSTAAQFWCTLSATFRPKGGNGRQTILLAIRQIDCADGQTVGDQLKKAITALGLPKNVCHSRPLLLVRPIQFADQLDGDDNISVLPSIFPDCLLRSFYDALANDDHPIGPLLYGLNENVRQFFGKNEEAQKEWTEKTGIPQKDLANDSSRMDLLENAMVFLEWREEFDKIAIKYLGKKVIGENEWQQLAELAQLLGQIHSQMADANGPEGMALGKVAGRLEKLHSNLQNDYPDLGEFPAKISAILAERTGKWLKDPKSPYNCPDGASSSSAFTDVPCTPLGLENVFGRNGNGNGGQQEWMERTGLLLYNFKLLTVKRQEEDA